MMGARHIHNFGATGGNQRNLRAMVGMTYGETLLYTLYHHNVLWLRSVVARPLTPPPYLYYIFNICHTYHTIVAKNRNNIALNEV